MFGKSIDDCLRGLRYFLQLTRCFLHRGDLLGTRRRQKNKEYINTRADSLVEKRTESYAIDVEKGVLCLSPDQYWTLLHTPD